MYGRLGLRFTVFLTLSFLAACATRPPSTAATYPTSRTTHQVTVDSDRFDYGHPYITKAGKPLQCVPYARNESGIQIHGNANRWWTKAAGRYPRGSRPTVGSVMVLKGYQSDKRGHVAVVRKIVSRRIIIIDHANWYGRGEISKNTPVEDVSRANDWSQVRVWWIPGTRWGQRVNRVEGFIYRDQAIASR